MVLLVANIIILSVCIMLDIFMVSYFLTKQGISFFILKKMFLRFSYHYFTVHFLVESKLGSLLVWRSEKSKFLQDTYQHMYVYIQSYISQLFLIETNPMFIHAS